MFEDNGEQFRTCALADSSPLFNRIGNFFLERLVHSRQVFTYLPCIEIERIIHRLPKCRLKLVPLHCQDFIHFRKIPWTLFRRLVAFHRTLLLALLFLRYTNDALYIVPNSRVYLTQIAVCYSAL